MFGAASATRLGLASEWVASGSARCLRRGCAQAICARGARRDQRLDAETQAFLSNGSFSLHKMNGRQFHRLLARMIDDRGCRRTTSYAKRGGKSGSEIEHVWADHPERHEDEFAHPSEFAEYRNRIGGLLLLPKSFNASYGDLPYEQKLVHYDSQNLLARSLDPNAYDHNQGFRRFVEQSGLPFRPHAEFRKADLDDRQELYGLLADYIWNPARLDEAVAQNTSMGY